MNLIQRLKVCMTLLGLLLAIGWLITPKAISKEATTDQPIASQLVKFPATEPADTLKLFSVAPGFRVDLVAAEPLVHSPVAMDFDADGRLYVVEMCDYSEQENEFLGKVRLLEDTNGDGKFDKSTIFADRLSWPTAIIAFDGGVFIGASPDILYCKDTTGDGKADLKKTIFKGFSRSNVQGMLNSFRWGLDNRIHGATSSNGGKILLATSPQAVPLDLNGRDFSFDPRKLDLRAESGSLQHGMSFDDWGLKFVCGNSNHLQMVFYEDRYMARNPLLTAPAARGNIADDGDQAEIYRTSPVEVWRELRTRLRVEGKVQGMVEKGGRASGFFSGATGITPYRGDAFSEEMRNQVFVADPCSNLVHRKKLTPHKTAFVASRVEQNQEFLSSSDTWFRPVQLANAPDGGLYLMDMYREVIEHPKSIPLEIKQHIDLTSGRDRGRIYRVVPTNFKQPALPRLAAASSTELVKKLASRNGWQRDTSARLLFERQDVSVVPALQQLALSGKLPEGRMHALYVLQGMGQLTSQTILAALADKVPQVREHAVRLAEGFTVDPQVFAKLVSMANDDDLRVRYQLAFTLGEFKQPERLSAFATLAIRDGDDPYFRAAIFSSLAEGTGELFWQLAKEPKIRNSDYGQAILKQLAFQIGAQLKHEDVSQFDKALAALTSEDEAATLAVVQGFVRGRAKASPERQKEVPLSSQLKKIHVQLLQQSAERALDESQPLAARIDAVRMLASTPYEANAETYAALFETHQPFELQVAMVRVLGEYKDPAIGKLLTQAWPQLSPRLRAIVGDILFSRAAWIVALLDALESKQIAISELELGRLKMLETRTEPEIATRFQKLVGQFQVGARQEILEQYQAALALKGNPAEGKIQFQKNCSTCHRLEGVGFEIGPNLASFKERGAAAILMNVIDPNREVNPQYVNYMAILNDGRTLTGLIASETATGITLKRAQNLTDTIQRSDLEALRSTRQSIMPEGLEKQLDLQHMADVISYILSIR